MGEDSSEDDDLVLLERWRTGDTAAAERLLMRHFSSVYRYFVARLGRNAMSDAEDLTQKTFVACVAGRDRVDGEMRAYLYGVARRMLADDHRKRSVRGLVVTPSAADLLASGDPSVALRQADAWDLLSEALTQLPLEFSSVLERFYLEEQPIAVIAKELGVAKGTVKSRLHRGKAMLRRALEASDASRVTQRSSLELVAVRPVDEDAG